METGDATPTHSDFGDTDDEKMDESDVEEDAGADAPGVGAGAEDNADAAADDGDEEAYEAAVAEYEAERRWRLLALALLCPSRGRHQHSSAAKSSRTVIVSSSLVPLRYEAAAGAPGAPREAHAELVAALREVRAARPTAACVRRADTSPDESATPRLRR